MKGLFFLAHYYKFCLKHSIVWNFIRISFKNIAVECGEPPNFADDTKCGGNKIQTDKKICDWNDRHDAWGGPIHYDTTVTYECPEG